MKGDAEAIQFPILRRPVREAVNDDLEPIGIDFKDISEAATGAMYEALARLDAYGADPATTEYFDDFLTRSAATTNVIPAKVLSSTTHVFDAFPTGIIVNYGRDGGTTATSKIRAHTYVPTPTVKHYHSLMADALKQEEVDDGLVSRLALKWTFYNAAAQAVVGLVTAGGRATSIGYEEWIGDLRSAFPNPKDVYNNPPAPDPELQLFYETLQPTRLVFGMGLDMLLNTPVRDRDIALKSQRAVDKIVRAHQIILQNWPPEQLMSSPYLLAAATPASLHTIRAFFAAGSIERL